MPHNKQLPEKIETNKIRGKYEEHNFDTGYHASGDNTEGSLKVIAHKVNELLTYLTEREEWSQCNDCYDGDHDKCIGKKKGCECKHSTEQKEKVEKLLDDNIDMIKRIPLEDKQKESPWEERFDSHCFCRDEILGRYNHPDDCFYEKENIKSFISKTRSELLEELRGEISKIRRECISSQEGGWHCGYCNALGRVFDILDNLKDK